MEIKVKVNQQDYGNRIVFAFLKPGPDPNKLYIFDGHGNWDLYEPGASHPDKVTLAIPFEGKDEILQQMADLLGAMGFKPQRLKAAVQEIERLENHLLDAINVRDRLLTIVEVEGGTKNASA